MTEVYIRVEGVRDHKGRLYINKPLAIKGFMATPDYKWPYTMQWSGGVYLNKTHDQLEMLSEANIQLAKDLYGDMFDKIIALLKRHCV